MAMEIDIHRSLQHKHVVQFYSFFEDKDNMFILLELCRRRVSIIVSVFCYVILSVVINGAPQKKEGAYRTRGPVLHETDSYKRRIFAQSTCHSQRSQTW